MRLKWEKISSLHLDAGARHILVTARWWITSAEMQSQFPFHNVHLTDVSTDCDNKFHTFLQNVLEWTLKSNWIVNGAKRVITSVTIEMENIQFINSFNYRVISSTINPTYRPFHFLLSTTIKTRNLRKLWGTSESGVFGKELAQSISCIHDPH